jgi:hemoglobin-like flavoprotein
MNLEAIALVQESLAQLKQAGDQALSLFHDRLRILDPAVAVLFPQEMTKHSHHFFSFLEQCVDGLAAPQTIMARSQQVGRTLAQQGVRPEHYQAVAQALFWTVAQVQGDAFTPAVAEAWMEAYYLLAGIMKETSHNKGRC